jgi:enamine deaminase RidA (YjgF/YER057c/UK114 family)
VGLFSFAVISESAGEAHRTEVTAVEAEAKLRALGFILPRPPQPVGSYLLAQQVGTLLFLSGTTCYTDGGLLYKGRLGEELTVEQGQAAARQTMLNLLAVIKSTLGDLDRVERVIKLNGYVNSALNFDRQPEVINGASELLEQIYGESGRHARTSIGVSDLPGHIPVEIELVIQVRAV